MVAGFCLEDLKAFSIEDVMDVMCCPFSNLYTRDDRNSLSEKAATIQRSML